MGVTGLHQQLKEIQTNSSLSKYKGQTLAVDTYGWLHKATVSCAQELCLDQPTGKYVSYVTKKIDMLRYFGVEPYLVFDGASLPTKAQTANERRVKREEAQKKADQLMKSGNRKLAWKEFMKAAAVTSSMAKSVMIELRRLNVKYVVAPYEADPQMVYLEKIGEVDGILSEDSDLLIFGCNKLITKLNEFGECIEINRADFNKVKAVNGLDTFTPEQLRLVAMLSGCDYTKGIPGIGLKTAFSLVKKYQTLERVLMALRAEGKKTPEEFEDEVVKADLAFQYQKVFNPRTKALATLNDYPEDFPFDLEVVEQCCGLTLENSIHVGISNGSLNPHTHDILMSREQNISQLKSKSFGSRTGLSSKPIAEQKMPRTSTIDKFFSVKKAVKVTSEPLVETKEKVTRSEQEKLSPMHKRTKKTIDLPEDMNETPKLSGKLSKFFKSSPNDTLPTPTSIRDEDITGDSEISEASSPFAHVKTSQHAISTTNILENVTDEDEEFMTPEDEQASEEDQVQDSVPKELATVSKSSYKETIQKLSGDLDFDDEDEEIDESPVKVKDHKTIDNTHYLEDRKDLKKLLRETFSFNPNSDKKFEIPSSLQSAKSDDEFRPPLAAKMNSQRSVSSLSSTSSLDLKADDLKAPELEKENTINSSQDSFKLKAPIKTSSLSKFAFSG